jgi:3'-5' exoribonuclease
MTLPDLTRLVVGERVQHAFLVLDTQTRSYGDGKALTVLTLGNASGQIDTAPFWDGDPRADGITRGLVVQVIGEIAAYRDRRQLQVTSIRVLPDGEVNLAELLPSAGDPARYWRKLDEWRAAVRGPRLRAVLGLFFDDEDFHRRFEQCPASPRGHHAQLGGLLRHVTEVAAIGRMIAKVSGADEDLVFAGALLHDIGKLECYRWDGVFEYTDVGRLYGHVVLGSLMFDRVMRACKPAPCLDGEEALIQHMILSHHGKPEFGAAVPPMTLEAEILHYADNASAKSASMADVLADASNFTDDALVTTRKPWQLDGRWGYRGKFDWGRENPDGGSATADLQAS